MPFAGNGAHNNIAHFLGKVTVEKLRHWRFTLNCAHRVAATNIFTPLTHRSMTLEVLAQDEGTDSSPVLSRVNVIVRDVNDNRPHIDITSSRVIGNHGNGVHGNVVSVEENSVEGVEVCQVSVSDDDTGQSGHVTCRIRPSIAVSRHFPYSYCYFLANLIH